MIRQKERKLASSSFFLLWSSPCRVTIYNRVSPLARDTKQTGGLLMSFCNPFVFFGKRDDVAFVSVALIC